jgi:hypothetical protein
MLDKSLAIAELRSPNRDDGVIARILVTQAKVLDSNPSGTYHKEAEILRKRADIARQQLLAAGEGGDIPILGGDNCEHHTEEDDYDALVPLFYR